VTAPTAPDFLDLPDLACEDVGGAALACNDEFFAPMENLLRAHPAEWRDHEYTDRGKWMDGWETRRRREPGHDTCVIRLGMPGVIRGVVVDTAFFRGNYPAECSIEACEIDDPLDLAALQRAEWTEILPKSSLEGDAKNSFAVAAGKRFTHLRLHIYPDGGVARLRVHGEVRAHLQHGTAIDLAALENGAWVESCSDMFFGSRNNLIKPGPSRTMADGWETRRRRGPGHDWAIIRLAAPGTIDCLVIDTSHFKGNAPGRCTVEGRRADGDWRPLLASPLQPHTRHLFDEQLRRIGDVTHLRLSVHPDGGVARLRAWGVLPPAVPAGLTRLNAMATGDATAALTRCCGSTRWAIAMETSRPFEDVSGLLRCAERTWWTLEPQDWLEAFAAHPRIGERSDAAWSKQEQSGAASAATAILDDLASANQAYVDKFGFIYIVCASGRGGGDMLADLHARLASTRDQELRTAGEEQAKITRLRLRKLLGDLERENDETPETLP
jgi:allantoicase